MKVRTLVYNTVPPESRTLNPESPFSRVRRFSLVARKPLLLSRSTVRALAHTHTAGFFPVHPFDFRALPAAVSVATSSVIVALCIWTFDGQFVSPSIERSILVTVLDREPELDDPHQAAVIPDEPRTASAPTEVPPPPERDPPNTELPALVVQLARRAHAIAVTPTWIDNPVAPEPSASPSAAGDTGAFWRQVRQLIAAKVVYPPAAVRRGAAGKVVLRVRIGPQGELMVTEIAASSADGALDRAALSAVRESAPFPVRELGRRSATNTLEALIPVRFELVEERSSRRPAPH